MPMAHLDPSMRQGVLFFNEVIRISFVKVSVCNFLCVAVISKIHT